MSIEVSGWSEPYECMATARVPGGVELQLIRHGDDFTIAIADNDLMSTSVSASEVALATLTNDRLGDRPRSEWLIGGYGMGFTLRAALNVLRGDACVTVAELVPEIIEWARGPMQKLTAGCLDDHRVALVCLDVMTLIDAAVDAYDAILLDVDNGPEGLSRRSNGTLYSLSGLRSAWMALKPGGILAIWSAFSHPPFVDRLEASGFKVAEVHVGDGHETDGDMHVLWFAQKQPLSVGLNDDVYPRTSSTAA